MAADKRVLAALAGAARHGVETTVLFPAAAGLNDRAESVRSVADALRGAERFVLKQYDPTHGHADAIFSRRAVVPHWRLHELAREAKPFFRDVRVRTRGFGEEAA
jgi:pyruvate-formate lyase-activating enzyme